MSQVTINLPDICSRVEHGYHLTNPELRWLLKQIGQEVPSKKRCERCNATGLIDVCDDVVEPPIYWDEPCHDCSGSGYLPGPEPEYNVIESVTSQPPNYSLNERDIGQCLITFSKLSEPVRESCLEAVRIILNGKVSDEARNLAFETLVLYLLPPERAARIRGKGPPNPERKQVNP